MANAVKSKIDVRVLPNAELVDMAVRSLVDVLLRFIAPKLARHRMEAARAAVVCQ